MLRAIRRKLHEIRYHSALPPPTAWSRAADLALVAAVLLALPATWLCDVLVSRTEAAFIIDGRFGRRSDGTLVAGVYREDVPTTLDSDGLTAGGRFTLSIDDRHTGWPFATTTARQPAVIDLDLLSEPKPRMDARLDADDPIRLAIAAAIDDAGQAEALSVLRDGSPPPRARWRQWTVNVVLWWIMLTFGLVIGVRLVQLGWMHAQVRLARRRLVRLATGHCHACGYDLRGLEFHERCPECGSLVE